MYSYLPLFVCHHIPDLHRSFVTLWQFPLLQPLRYEIPPPLNAVPGLRQSSAATFEYEIAHKPAWANQLKEVQLDDALGGRTQVAIWVHQHLQLLPSPPHVDNTPTPAWPWAYVHCELVPLEHDVREGTIKVQGGASSPCGQEVLWVRCVDNVRIGPPHERPYLLHDQPRLANHRPHYALVPQGRMAEPFFRFGFVGVGVG